jgi:hypothetical protein
MMNKSRKPVSDFEFDQWMHQLELVPPVDFEPRVLRRIAEAELTAPVNRSLVVYLFKPLRWLVVASGGAFALSELLAFMFGFWTVSTAL